MKKTLVALAALAATSAFAQSTVEIYGIIDQSVATTTGTLTNDGGTAQLKAKTTGAQSGLATQRIGFRGTEDLGGGNKALFQIEQGLSAGVNNGTDNRDANGFGTRPTFVGLSNALGTVTLGRQDTPLLKAVVPQLAGGANNAVGQIMWSSFNVSSLTTLAPFTGTAASGTDVANAGLSRVARQTTVDQAINYKTPTINGFDAEIQIGKNSAKVAEAGAGATATAAATVAGTKDSGLNIKYANGPLTLNLASHKNTAETGPDLVEGRVNKNSYVGATYQLGTAKLSLQHGKSESAVAGVQGYNIKANQLGLQLPVAAQVNAFASAGRGKRMIGTEAAGNEFKQSSLQAGLAYSFSKRTTAYAVYGTQKLTGNNAAVNDGTSYKEKQTVFGLNHSF